MSGGNCQPAPTLWPAEGPPPPLGGETLLQILSPPLHFGSQKSWKEGGTELSNFYTAPILPLSPLLIRPKAPQLEGNTRTQG